MALAEIGRLGSAPGLIQACLINRLADSTERIEPLLATVALVEEVSNRLFDQFVTASIVAVSEFLLDLFCQIRRQRYVHDLLLRSEERRGGKEGRSRGVS